MTDSGSVSERDVALVHAMQINPRAPYALLADVLGVSPSTLRRRWERLRAEGLAWVTATPSARFVTAGCIAYVEVRCKPSLREQVAEVLSGEHAIAALDLTAGPADLMLSLATSDLLALSNYLIGRLDRIPGVLSTNTLLVTRGYREGSGWRLDALDPGQIAALRPPTYPQVSLSGFTPLDMEMLHALGEDGRMSHAELATRAGVSAATARRRLDKLVASSAIALRCDLAAPDFGWPVLVYLSARVTPARLSTIARAVSQISNIRLVTTVTGSANMLIGAWLHSIASVSDLEERIGNIYPDWHPIDRIIVLRAKKRAGRLLDTGGRAVATIPMIYGGGAASI